MWRVWLCDTKTGEPLARVPFVSGSWSRVLNGQGQGQTVFPAKAARKFDFRTLTELVSTTTVHEWDGKVVYAGVNWTRSYDPESGQLTVSHSDLWSLMKARLLISRALPVQGTTVQLGPSSLATLIKGVIVHASTTGADSTLPLAYLPNEAGTEAHTYYGYELQTAFDAITDLMTADGGPDVDFLPRWAFGSLQWFVRTGTAAAPQLAEGSWDFPMNVPRPALTGVKVTEDAQKVQTDRWGTGDGQEEDMLVAHAAGGTGSVLLDRVTSFTDAKSQSTLNALTAGEEKTFRAPTQQFTGELVIPGRVAPSDLLLGGSVNLQFAGDPFIPDGKFANRLIQFSGDLGSRVTLGFQTLEAL